MPVVVVVPQSVSSSGVDEREVNSSSALNAEYGGSRLDTEQILDYYQSEEAGRTYISSKGSYHSENYPSQRERKAPPTSAQSTMRPGSVGRDTNRSPGRTSMDSVASSSGGVQRRTSQRSAGGADKRRLAIVELDTRPESQVSSLREQRLDTSSSLSQPPLDLTLLARRGVDGSRLGSLALVSPPDAQPLNFTDLSPIPASAPATGVPPTYRGTTTETSHSGHQRSMSDAQSRKKGGTKTSPRDVGIVGTLGSIHSGLQEQTQYPRPERQRPSTSDGDCGSRSDALTAPVFQTPRSRSPSPLPAVTGVPPSTNLTGSNTHLSPREQTVGDGQQLTPGLGQEKDIGFPVVGPVVLDVSSGQPIIGRSSRTTTSGSPTEPQTSSSHSTVDRDTQRISGRLPFKPNQSGPSFLHYQPGVHSTAGPLPSPPRHILTHHNSLPPPRPPRVLSPPPSRRNEGDHTKKSPKAVLLDGLKPVPITSLRPPAPASLADSDYSISAISASSSGSDDRSPGLTSSVLDGNETVPRLIGRRDQTDKPSGNHIREGAFPASSVFLSHPSQSPPSQSQPRILDKLVASIGGPPEHEDASSSTSALPSTVEALPVLRHSQGRPDLTRENSWVSLTAESCRGGPDDTSPPSSYPSSGEEPTRVVTTTVGSDDGLVNRERVSLPAPPSEPRRLVDSSPRTSSLLSIPLPSRSQASSPSSMPLVPKKAPSSWPDAMNFYDVLAKKTAAERALAYAAKVRELATEESGLKEWLYLNARKERREATPATVPSTVAASRVFVKQPRHLSRNSMTSEVTFPIRQDSYTATDLSPRPSTDMLSLTSPSSTLPYPSLAHGVGIRKRASRTLAVDSSVTSLSGSSKSLGGGFFASIGRKASMKKDRPFPPTSPARLISSRQPPQPPQPRPVKLGTPPTLPGGPRAPARSAQRANSVVFNSPEPPRIEGQVLSMPARPTVGSTEAFDRQVEKLSDLLPQADKDTLVGYLRRAHNQDPMLAIGAYLEDEKQGCLRLD